MPKVIDLTKQQQPQTLTFDQIPSTQQSYNEKSYIPLQSQIIDNYDAEERSKYTTSPFGGYLKTEDDMSKGQSSTEQWMHGLSKGVANIPLKFMEGMGYAYGLGKWGIKDGFKIQNIDDLINNDFSKYFHEASKSLDQSLPIYGSFDYQTGNILQKMSTAKFWANDAVDGLSFLASAYGGSFIGKGIGKAFSAAGEGLGMTAEAANTLNKWSSFASGTIYNTVSESGFEAKDSYESVYNDLVSKGLDPRLAKEKASQAAANTFTSNLAILSLSNALEMKAFMGNPVDESKKLFRQIARGEISTSDVKTMKQVLKGALVGVGSEGLYEEGMQNATQQFQKKKAQGFENGRGFTGGYFNEWLKGFSDTEGQASMILGALIGGPFQAHSYYSEAKQKISDINRLTTEVDKQREYLKKSDGLFQSFLENRYKKDKQGNILYNDNNEPILNEEWYKNKAFQIQLDEDYRNEKLAALLEGDLTHAAIVDQYYTSRKMWDYLANPLFENTDEAFDAFKKQLNTQFEEYTKISNELEQQKKDKQLQQEQPFNTPEELNLKEKVNAAEHASDLKRIMGNLAGLKQEFDSIQDKLSIDPSDVKSTFIYEKLNKALFHEATKRLALQKALQDSNLSESEIEKINNLLESSNNFSNKLLDKKERAQYIDDVKTEEDQINSKREEAQNILNKYKETEETKKETSKLDLVKNKAKGLIKPIVTRFQKEQADQQAPQDVKEKQIPLEDKLSTEDKKRLKQLGYDIAKYNYQHGRNYLNRIDEAYRGDTFVGKKHMYYEELGKEVIRKEKIKDSINTSLQELDLIAFTQITEDSYKQLEKIVSNIFEQLQQLTRLFNDNGSKTNYTSEDLKYVEEIQQKLTDLLNQIENNIDDTLKTLKEGAAEFNQYKESISNSIDTFINIINNLYEGEIYLDEDEVNKDLYNIFGKDLLYLSFMNNYFIDNYNKESIIIMQGFENGAITKEEALSALSEIIELNSPNIETYTKIKESEFEQIVSDIPDVDLDRMMSIENSINIVEQQKEDIQSKEDILKAFEEIKEFSKKNVNSNKFLQLWKKDMDYQDEFFESLFIEENPEFSFQLSKIIVEKYKKDLKEKNESELEKIEDVFYYQNILAQLKDLKELLEPRNSEFKSSELKATYDELLSLINSIENFIIPLAIKNQNNRKVIQQISSNIRDKSYFNQLGLNVEIDFQGNLSLKETTRELLEEVNKLYENDITKSKFPEQFSFLVLEDIIRDLKGKTKEELKPLFELIEKLKKEVALEIQTFKNENGQAKFQSNTIFDNYLVNPDTIIEQLIYTMSSFHDKASRTYNEKENWFSSPLYNYSKHLSPALLLDELKKKKFSGSMVMPYAKLIEYLELHLEYTALINLNKNLNSDLDFNSYYNKLKEATNSFEFAPTYQQEIALREAFDWWNNKQMILSYLKGVAGTGKTSVFLKYFLDINNISLDNVILSAHNTSAVNTLKAISTSANGLTISELLNKTNDFFKNTNLIVIDEVNANSDEVISNLLNKLTTINKEREKDNQLKILFMGDPTQLKVSDKAFIDYFNNHGNKFGIKYGNLLKTFSPLTVAYRSDVGSINNLANSFRDTDQVIEKLDLQSSSEITDKQVKGTALTTSKRTNGMLNTIFERLNVVKEENTTKAIIVSTIEEVNKYTEELGKRGINNVEVITIENAQGRTFDEVYVDIIKSTLFSIPLAQSKKNDLEYFFNTVMYTATSRAKNFVLLFDNDGSFTSSIKDEVKDTNQDLIKEKQELKNKILNYIDFALSFYNNGEKTTEEVKEKEEEIKHEEEVQEQIEKDEEEFENDVPGLEEPEVVPEPEMIPVGKTTINDYGLHEIQNPEVNVLEEKKILDTQSPASAQINNEVIYMKSADGNIYAYVEDSNSSNYYRYLTTIYPENLRDEVPSEKHLKEQYYNNTITNLISYNKNSLSKDSINKAHQIASGKIFLTQKLQFIYEKYNNRQEVEQLIQDKGGLYQYIEERLLPLITNKDSDEKYGKIVDYRVFIATEQDTAEESINALKEAHPGSPYLKFKVEKYNKKSEKRIQEFFIKLESPTLKNTDAIVAPLITFYNSVKVIENMFDDMSLPEIKLGNNDFAKLLLKFKDDFTAIPEKKKNFKGEEYDHYNIVPKEQTIVTKEDIYDILKNYNLTDDNLSEILSTLQKESRDLIPLLFSSKKDKVKVSSYGYLKFLEEQAQLGNIDETSIKDFRYIINAISGSDQGKQMNEIMLNKTELNELNVIKSFRAFGYDLNSLEENVFSVVQETRRRLTANSFVPITQGENKGMYYAFDPLIGQVVVIEKIPERKFVSQSYTNANNIKMFDYEDVKLSKKNSPLQYSFNSISRSNGVLNKGTENEINIRLKHTLKNEKTILFAPTLLKESKFDSSFDSKYYAILSRAFDEYVQEQKRLGNKYVFDLSYADDYGNNIEFQYKDQLNAQGKSIWKNQNVIGKFRKEASLQHENALRVMKDFLISKGVTIKSEDVEEIASEELFNNLEQKSIEFTITSNDLKTLADPEAFDENGNNKAGYKKNVDRNTISDSQDVDHGGKAFENNIPLQNSVTTRFKQILPSRVVVAMNGVKIENKTQEQIQPEPVKTERKTLQESGKYTLEQMEDGSFIIFDNGENAQELFKYDLYDEALEKFNKLTGNIISDTSTQDINKIEEEIKGTSFEGLGEFSKELGGSDVESVPTDLRTINNFPVVSFSNPNTKVVDVIVSGISDNNFVGFYRLYKNGEATNIWSSKMENQSGDKKNFVGMRNAVQEMLPSSHEYTEKTSISTDGLKMWIDQLRHGYSIKRDNSGKIVTNEVAINGDSKENILGIWIKKGDFSNITITNQKDFKTAKEALIPFLEKLGLNESNIHSTNGTIEIDLPVLVYNKNKDMKSENKSNIDIDFISKFISEQEGFDETEQATFDKRFNLLTNKLKDSSPEEILDAISDKFDISKESLQEAIKGKDLKDKC